MAANGISTLSSKLDRKLAKIALATASRQSSGTNSFRALNNYTGSVSPTIGRPWSLVPPAINGGTASSLATATINGGNANSTGGTGNPVDGGNAASTF